jgi:hypothetical protein
MSKRPKGNWQWRPRRHSILKIFISALSALRNPVVALPSVIYFCFHIAIMVVYLRLQNDIIHSFWTILVRGADPEIFNHYPQHIILMQTVLERFDIFLDIFVHIIIQGWLVVLVATSLSRRNPSAAESFSITIKRYGHLLAVSIISSGAVFLIMNISEVITSSLFPSGRLISAAGSVLLALAVQGALVYAAPFILLEKENLFSSIRKSFSLARRALLLTSLLIVIPFILTLPSVLLDIKAEMISFRLSPDFIIYNHTMGELLQTIATFLMTSGSVVILMMDRMNLLGRTEEPKEEI